MELEVISENLGYGNEKLLEIGRENGCQRSCRVKAIPLPPFFLG